MSSPERARTPSAESPWDVPALGAGKIAVSALVLASGFFALSDDDFSRVVIAERFAAFPRLDPSGTSWLPLPFWLTGGAMAALGRNLEIARAVAIVSGVLSVLLVHRAALWLGMSRWSALAGAAVAGVVPTSARLGVSFQPEALTSGLILLGAAAAAGPGANATAGIGANATAGPGTNAARLGIGGAALFAACLCRYEAWPAAAAFAALCFGDAWRQRSKIEVPGSPTSASRVASPGSLAVAGFVALLGPAAWLAHGARNHGDALFFLHRVTAFRRALGETESPFAALAAYPIAFFASEPELCLAGGAALATVLVVERAALAAFVRPAFIAGAVLAFLVLGRFLDGAPTHHPERTLLSLYCVFALAAVAALARLVVSAGSGNGSRPILRPRAAATFALLVGLGLFLRWLAPEPAFEDRAMERSVGSVARREAGPPARVAIDTPDYGYFAVMAAFGAPERAEPLVTHDPRDPEPDDPFRNTDTLRARLARLGATWLVAHREHWPVALQAGEPVVTRGDLALVRIGEKP